jgi:hypothetical protein
MALYVYAAFLARSCSVATIKNYLKDLRFFFVCLDVEVA